jgi:hypothetical protein
MIALALAVAFAATPVQTLSTTWLKCDWKATRTKIVAGKSGDEEISDQSRIYKFDPNTNRLSVYNSENLTLDMVFGVLVTDYEISAQTTHIFAAANGVNSQIFKSFTIDRRTLKFSQLDSVEPLWFAPSTNVFTTGTGQCVKIDPKPLTPPQF